MTRCAVRDCKSGTFSNNVSHLQKNIRPPTLFMVPKSPTAIAKWETALHQINLSPKARVCELHFADEDVKRSDDTLMPDGSIFRLPRQKYSLCKNAVPKDLANQENKAPENEEIYMDKKSDGMSNAHEITKVNNPLSDHQYYIDTNKPGQYCYYNKKVAACSNTSIPNRDLDQIIKKELNDLNKIITENKTEDEKNVDNEVTDIADVPSNFLHHEESHLTIESIINYLTKNPIKRSWSWMKFTNKGMGITFTQIHTRTRKVRCYVELHEDLNILIQTGDEQISLEIEFEITCTEHVLDLLSTVENMKICNGAGFETKKNRDENCNGVILDEEFKTAYMRDRCEACKNLRNQLLGQKKYTKVDIRIKYQKSKRELCLLRRKCKYYENKLSLKNKRLKNIKQVIESYNQSHKNPSAVKN